MNTPTRQQRGTHKSNQRENHRKDVAGRANVEDTPERLAYYDQLDNFSAGALWTVANKIEPWAPKHQSVGYPVDDMTKPWGNAGLAPSGGAWKKGSSPMFKYEWAPTYEALVKYASATDGSPFDGVLMEYVNPATNGPVMRTLGASMQLWRAGEHTQAHRQTGSAFYHAAKGRGHAIIHSKRHDWQERDVFCVPSWAWHEHVND